MRAALIKINVSYPLITPQRHLFLSPHSTFCSSQLYLKNLQQAELRSCDLHSRTSDFLQNGKGPKCKPQKESVPKCYPEEHQNGWISHQRTLCSSVSDELLQHIKLRAANTCCLWPMPAWITRSKVAEKSNCIILGLAPQSRELCRSGQDD